MRLIHLTLTAFLIAAPAFAVPRAPLDATNKPDLSKQAGEKGKAEEGSVKPIQELTGAERAEKIERVEAYLSTISSVVAHFSQSSADGSMAEGKFFMKRPGKMRWQYNKPSPILLVSDGKTVTYYDSELQQVSYIGIDDTLAGFLARKDLKLDSPSTRLTSFEGGEGVIRATVIQRKKPTEGSLMLEFSDNPMEIKRMVAVDATGNQTDVQLYKAQFGPVLDDKLFVFVDPRPVNQRRNKR